MADPEGVAMPVDPYEAVLADLRAKRDDIERVILTLESYRSGAPIVGVAKPEALKERAPTNGAVLGSGAFLGMNIVDATKALLASRRQQMSNPEIAAALKAGGLVMNSAQPANTIGSVLTRRFQQVGDVVRVGRGMWGLAEWHPNVRFKKRPIGEVMADRLADLTAEEQRDPIS